MEASTPVYTLSRNVPNYIIGVSDTHIHRRSAEGHSVDQQTTISRRMIATLWSELSRDGQTSKASITHVLRFTYALLQRSVPGIAFDPDPYFRLVLVDSDEANREFDPTADPTPGLAPLPTRTGGSGRSIGGGGGEGPIHAAIKAKIKNDPVAAVGERLTFLSEDLSERLGDEIRFATGDRVDLLMKDQDGNYVVIEVEPTIGPHDDVGFLQAAKYWVLLAVSKRIALDRVRRMVAATSVDRGLRELYEARYGIEWREVSLP